MPGTTANNDETLSEILAELLGAQQAGQEIDIDLIAGKYPPALAEELRQLWATAEFARTFAKPPLETPFAVPIPARSLPKKMGDYELLEEIGRGGMGVVYKARQQSLGRLVALKVMRENRFASESDMNRFRAEAAAAAKLAHPNIVTVHEVSEFEGQPFFVMEYIEGQNLSQAIHSTSIKPRDAAKLLAEVARAVQHAHEQGILHRDLKPSNILLATTGKTLSGTLTPKVTDFGLAKRLDMRTASTVSWRTQTGAIVGTPGYMAPEQVNSRREMGPTTDVYGLGAILYELLTSRPPFLGATPVDTLLLVLEQEPVPPRVLVPGIDRDLEMICLKCLQKSPAGRYATAADVADDIEAYLAGESLSSQPSGLRYFFSRMLRETHHVSVLENWGLLWMWHSLATFLLCLLTQVMAWLSIDSHEAYLLLWSVGLITWGSILWKLRSKAGPVLFVERQIAHAWASGVCASIGMFLIEVVTDQPPLTLSPAIAIAAGMVFIFKAGILSGQFYITAAVMFVTATIMPLVPDYSVLLFGSCVAMCFFVPGLKYYRLKRDAVKSINQYA